VSYGNPKLPLCGARTSFDPRRREEGADKWLEVGQPWLTEDDRLCQYDEHLGHEHRDGELEWVGEPPATVILKPRK
jgi:hypothetical protein